MGKTFFVFLTMGKKWGTDQFFVAAVLPSKNIPFKK
jgi:hypothetical protein